MTSCMMHGRLVKDPDLRELEDKNTCVCNLKLSVHEYIKNQGDRVRATHHFDLQAWDSGARSIAERAKKGDDFICTVIPREHRWKEQTEDGERQRSRIIFRVEQFHIISNQDAE